jgi:dienelactone hydrolase
MSQPTKRHEITFKPVVYRLPGMDDVVLRQDLEVRRDGAGAVTMDVYSPPGLAPRAAAPAVVFVLGYSDEGARAHLGCRLKEMAAYVSWGRLVAASGLAAITYSPREPMTDLDAVLSHARRNASALSIDANRIGVWACSGNVPAALGLLMQRRPEVRCAVLCYGFMLDDEASNHVATASQAVGFVDPNAGKSVADLPPDLPLHVVRAGKDEFPHLNDTIDRFTSKALALNLPITVRNLPGAPHAFDIQDDSETARDAVAQVLRFLQTHLLSEVQPQTAKAL